MSEVKAQISEPSKVLLNSFSPMEHVDLMKDILFDCQTEYNIARERCGFAPLEFPFP